MSVEGGGAEVGTLIVVGLDELDNESSERLPWPLRSGPTELLVTVGLLASRVKLVVLDLRVGERVDAETGERSFAMSPSVTVGGVVGGGLVGGERGDLVVEVVDLPPPNELAVAVVVCLAQRATSSMLRPLLTESERVRLLVANLLGDVVSVRNASDVSCVEGCSARGVSVPDGGVEGGL